jgi:hypothetical protein
MRNPPANAKPMESAKPTIKFIDGGAVPVNSPPTKPPMIRPITKNAHAKINISQVLTVTKALNICGIFSSSVLFYARMTCPQFILSLFMLKLYS